MRTPIACIALAVAVFFAACGGGEERGVAAIAFRLDQPGATLFVGNPEDDTLVLEPGDYRIVATDHDERVAAFQQFSLDQPTSIRLPSAFDFHDPQLSRDIRTVGRALLRVDYARISAAEAASAGFTAPLYTSTAPTLADTVSRLEGLNATLALAAGEDEEVQVALTRLDAFSESREAPLSVSVRPVLRFGVFDAIKEQLQGFFGFAGEAGQRAAADITKVSEQLTPDQRADAFADVAPGLTGGAQSFDELLEKLQSGELDANAAQIRAQLWANPEFITAAQDSCECNNPALTTAHTEGAELVTKGAELNVQVVKTVLGDVFPDITTGIEYAEKADEWAEYARDLYKDPLGTLDAQAREAAAEALKERILGDMEGCCPDLDEEDVESAAENLAGQLIGLIPPLRPEEEEEPAPIPAATTTAPTATTADEPTETPEPTSEPTARPTSASPTDTPEPTETPEPGEDTATPEPTDTPGATTTGGTQSPTASPTASSTPTPTTPAATATQSATATPTPSPTPSPTATTAAVTNFAGTWNSAGTCDNPSAPFRWTISLAQNGSQVTGTIMFHQCPGGGQAGYSVSGTATSAGTVSLAGTKFHALGGLGGSAPDNATFTVAPGGAPSPNYAP